MIPLCIPNLAGNEARYLQECVESNFVSSVGPFVERFEEMVATASGASRAVATSSGTTGLHAALTAAGVGRDDLVVLPSLTFIASANAIAHCGADPWLVDVDEASWTLDAAALGEALARETERIEGTLRHRGTGRRVAALMPVHTLGVPADMDPILALASEYRVPVIADAAAALGAVDRTRPIGKLGADLSVLSFNGNKTVTAGGGGAVIGDDEELTALVRHLTTTARVGANYDHDRVGFNYRMTNLQAAVGCAQLERVDELVAAKRRIAAAYDAAFADVPGLLPFPVPARAESACWFSGALLEGRTSAELVPKLREAEIDARPFWKPMHLQAPFAGCPCEPTPVSDRVWRAVLTLPCSTGLSEADQERVIAAVRNVLK